VAAVAVTNVLADHLERHGTRATYLAAKRRILKLLRDDGVALIPAGDPELRTWQPPRGRRVDVAPSRPRGDALYVEDELFRFGDEVLGSVRDLRLPGRFQRENALVALGLARALGADSHSLARAVGVARGLEHRLEDLGRRAGRRVIDNAVSTTPDSTIAALRELEPGVTLVCGGQSKRGLALEPLAELARERRVRAITFGASGAELAAAFRKAGAETVPAGTLEQALARAFEGAEGATVLFSPACSSFDAYLNFQARALAFRAALPPEDAAR